MAAESWQGRADHNAQTHPDRACCECARTFSHDELRADAGWDTTRDGWRCSTCSRRRRTAAKEVADRLLEQTEPRWTLVLSTPTLHDVFDGCLECEGLSIAAARLLRPGALSRSESEALRTAVLAVEGRPVKTCARERNGI
jgi:hypothetical protein